MHLAIIPDGNRRWAKQQGWLPWQGHRQALENARDLIQWCHDDPRIDVLTLWGFSTENWNRSQEEVDHLMRLFKEFLERERPQFHTNKTKFLHAGRRDRIPPELRQLIEDIEKETTDYTDFTFQIALDHGGRDEIVRAIKAFQKLPADKGLVTSEEQLRQHFDQPTVPDLDFIIRTSGEQRTSGFFIWQAAYAEWKFIDKYFPDLTPQDLAGAVQEFTQRQRRFGA